MRLSAVLFGTGGCAPHLSRGVEDEGAYIVSVGGSGRLRSKCANQARKRDQACKRMARGWVSVSGLGKRGAMHPGAVHPGARESYAKSAS